MTFDNDRFTDVISYLEDKYQLQIICPEEIADTLYLTLVVRDETKEEIFKEIARISHLQYSIHNGKHRLSNFTTQPMKHHEATLTKNKRFNHKEYDHFS